METTSGITSFPTTYLWNRCWLTKDLRKRKKARAEVGEELEVSEGDPEADRGDADEAEAEEALELAEEVAGVRLYKIAFPDLLIHPLCVVLECERHIFSKPEETCIC